MKMVAQGSCLLLLLLAILCSSPASASFLGFGGTNGGEDHEMRFKPRQPETLLETDGGSILQWRDSMMTHMGLMDARMVTVNPKSLLLPQYANSHRLIVVTKGCCHMGLMLPMGMTANIRKVYKGEVIAVPRGMPLWMYNDGDEPCTFLTFANIRDPMMHGRHKYEAFHLAGAQTKDEMGGIMHGFSKDMLMAAMDVDEDTVMQMMENQKGVAIVKMERAPGQDSRSKKGKFEEMGDSSFMADFGYQLERAHRDVVHPRAGQLTVVNSMKLPVLELMGMSVGCLKLDRKALTAPGWFTNADHMIYCVQGSARVQVACPTGKMACDVKMKEGDMMMVPKNYPVMMQAGDDGFDASIVMNSHRSISMHMTGKDSVFNMMHPKVRMGTFMIDEEMDMRVHEESKRRRSAILLPPHEKSQRSNNELKHGEDALGEEEGADAGSFRSSIDEVREAMWNMFEVV